jgi:acetolactate synthase-1/2/3 large subunit
MRRNGAEILCQLLARQGITTIAGIPGGACLPIYDALSWSGIRHVLARHEQGAGFIAGGMARAGASPAVCIATSGPGATNLLTALADAWMDSVPIVAITGQVPLPLIGTRAFQEVDILGMARPIVKACWQPASASGLLDIVPRAFAEAASARQGPVLIDIPKDVQTQEIDVASWPAPGRAGPAKAPSRPTIRAMAEALRRAERPVLYVGGGAVASGADEEILELSSRAGAPVVASLMGLGAVPGDDPRFFGMIGIHGTRRANRLVARADLIFAIGARFSDRTVGTGTGFFPAAQILRVDADESALGKFRAPHTSDACDARAALTMLLEDFPAQDRAPWVRCANELRERYPDPTATGDPLDPVGLARWIGQTLRPEDTVVTDVGQHQMWVAQSCAIRRPRGLLTSGGLGTMGFGLPAAIGAALARPGHRVACITGDGSILMNLQELATLAEQRLPVKVIVYDNGHLGMVRQQQALLHGGRFTASGFAARVDYASAAAAFGIPSIDLGDCADPRAALRCALDAPGPALVSVPIDGDRHVQPGIAPASANRTTSRAPLCGASIGQTDYSPAVVSAGKRP